MADIRVRIAPSPTGPLHVGTARTALFNFLFARRYGGAFVIRIEDTDLERSDKKYEAEILEGLSWLGITADESPTAGGPYGPYRQSERLRLYRTQIERLLDDGSAFYCFHSEAELDDERTKLEKARRPAVHWCNEYRTLDRGKAEQLRESGGKSIIRFKTPAGKTIAFNDGVRGELKFESDLLGDISIAKNIDTPLYNFAVVVDDEHMKISHVIRGEDHISNTPKQILFIEALGFTKPQYAHLPLLLGTDRSKLSKRHGATSIQEYRNLGYLPEALFNFMTLLGWNPGDDREVLDQQELIDAFSLEGVQKSGAIFDVTKLDWMNGEYIRKMQPAKLFRSAQRHLPPECAALSEDYITRVLALEQPRLKKLSEIAEKAGYFFREPDCDTELLRWKKMTDAEIRASLERSRALLEEHKEKPIAEIEKIFLIAATAGGDRGALLWPLRAALSGKKASPGPFEIIGVLGVERSLKRLGRALQRF